MLITKRLLGVVSLSSLFLFGLQSYTTAQWQDEQGIPDGLIEQAISENASGEVEPDNTTIETVRQPGQHDRFPRPAVPRLTTIISYGSPGHRSLPAATGPVDDRIEPL